MEKNWGDTPSATLTEWDRGKYAYTKRFTEAFRHLKIKSSQ